MFGSDYPLMAYPQLFEEWGQVGHSDEFLVKFFHGYAEAILGL